MNLYERVTRWALNQFYRKAVHRSTSAGAQHAGLPVALDSNGKLDNSLLSILDENGQIDNDHLSILDENGLVRLEHLPLPTINAWTPTDASGAGLTFPLAYGMYTRWGARVLGEAVLLYPATSDTSAAKVGGLPFTGYQPAAQTVTSGGWIFWTSYGAPIAPFFTSNGDAFQFNSGQTTTALTNAQLSGKSVRFGFSLLVADA